MAGRRYQQPSLRDELTCSICCDLFTDPVMLDCMHHFCKGCILRFWQGSSRVATCPHCRAEFPNKAFQTNYILVRVVDRVRWCTTEEHKIKVQKRLGDAVKSYQRQIKELVGMKRITEQKISHVKKTVQGLVSKVQDDFKWLHQILQEEESTLLAELKEEEVISLTMLQSHIQKLTEEISCLEKNMLETGRTLCKKGDRFLLEAEKVNTSPRPPAPLDPLPFIDTDQWIARFTGPLQYIMCRKMLKSIRPVPAPLTFDKETAHPNLIFSANMREVTEDPEPQATQVGSQCFMQCVNVLASDSFSTGCHYWEVWVGNKTKWDIGVAADWVDRKTKVKLCPENGYWALRLRNRSDYSAATVPWTPIPLQKRPRKVGVYLSCEEGRVGFYDAEDMVHLFTFHCAHTDRFYPFFSTCFSDGELNSEPMRICHLTL